MSETPLLKLPLLEAAQAQKHVTHNEALMLLDAALHLSVLSRAVASPPQGVAEGARYLIPAAPQGAWAARAGLVGIQQGGGWAYLTPRTGWRLWVEDERRFLLFDGGAWTDLRGSDGPSEITQLGVNATADEVNRLAVASSAVLFTHAGSGVQMKLNKNAAEDTASLLFQSGWSGRAELGLAGDDDFRLKVSADGSAWTEAMVIDRATGAVSLPATPPRSLFNQSLASQGPGFSVNTYLAGSAIAVPAGGLKAGTRYRLLFEVVKTAAGTGLPVITLRFGTAGALADPAIATLTFPAQTAVVDEGRFSLDVTFRAAGVAAVAQCSGGLTHTMASGGLANSPGPVRRATSAPFDATLPGAVIGVAVNAGTAAAWTVHLVQASLENLA